MFSVKEAGYFFLHIKMRCILGKEEKLMIIEIIHKVVTAKPMVLPVVLLTVFNLFKGRQQEDLYSDEEALGDNFPYPLFKR